MGGLNPEQLYGPALPEHGWIPAPRYVLRRHRVLKAIEQVRPATVLEIGCGPAALLCELSSRGLSCSALETSTRARELAIHMQSSVAPIDLRTEADLGWSNHFDLVMALEVLEHIKEDHEALLEWSKWIRPGGHLLMSVPAHQHQWNATDEWAGHIRRYENMQLRNVLSDAGLKVVRLESYGFPLANLIEPIRARNHARQLAAAKVSNLAEATAQSGTNRSAEGRLYPLQRSIPGRLAMAAAIAAQNLFLSTDLGRGYLALAQKPPATTD